MERIKKLADEMMEEVCGAKEYAERAIMYRVNGESNWSNRFREMANDELKHAGYLHELIVMDVDKLATVYTPPVEMMEKWDADHKKYIEKAAWVRQMLDM